MDTGGYTSYKYLSYEYAAYTFTGILHAIFAQDVTWTNLSRLNMRFLRFSLHPADSPLKDSWVADEKKTREGDVYFSQDNSHLDYQPLIW